MDPCPSPTRRHRRRSARSARSGTQFFAARTRPGERIAVSLVTIGDGVETAQVTVPTSGDTAAGFTYENPLG
jgi:hypothetical protein